VSDINRWDVHRHKDELYVSNGNTVYHREHGQLCITDRVAYAMGENMYLSFPITFKDKAAAYRWIQSGTIADLQEASRCLRIGFTKSCFEWR